MLTLELIKTIFLPLTVSYLNGEIPLKYYVITCMNTRSEYIQKFEYPKEQLYIDIIDDLYFDMDDVWLDYDPKNPESVEAFNSASSEFWILEPEFKERCKAHYQKMISLFKD
jgi:hypothetical protein